MICPSCESEDIQRQVLDYVVVHGQRLSVTRIVYVCNSCNGQWENTKDADWRPDAFKQLGIKRRKK